MFNPNINLFIEFLNELNSSIVSIYNSSFDVVYKKDNSPLTTADTLSHEKITNFLKKYYSNIPIISEENGTQNYPNFKTFFLVDPIDGTKEFVNKTGEFCICIALIENKRPIFGIISNPIKNEIFYAIKKYGTFVYKNKTHTKLEAEEFKQNVLISKSHLDKQVLPYIKQNLPKHNILRLGSALKFSYIIAGDADTTLRFAPTYLWDTAAGDIMLEELGKDLVDINTKEKLLYETKNLLNPGFVVF